MSSDEVPDPVYFPEPRKSKRLLLRNVREKQRAIEAEERMTEGKGWDSDWSGVFESRFAEMPASDMAVRGSDDSGPGGGTEDEEEDEIEDWSPPRDRAKRADVPMTSKPKPLSLLPFFRLAAAMEGDRKSEEMGEAKRFRPVPELQGEGETTEPAVDALTKC
jgi:hypothetical protein